MKFNSIKFEISILYTAILGLILIVFSGILYFISNSFLQQTDQKLKVKAQAVSLTIRSYLNVLGPTHEALMESVGKTLAIQNESFLQFRTWRISRQWQTQAMSLNLNKDYINFVSRDGKYVISSPNLDNKLRIFFMEDLQPQKGLREEFKTLNVRHKIIRIINYPITIYSKGPYLIQVGEVQDPFLQQLRNWLFSIAISVPLILFLTSFVGRILTNRILRPVYEITDMANKITQQDLTSRIKNKNFGSEMESLVESFNDMIDRLEKSFKHIEQFSCHVAHELKTPLTIIQGEAELHLRKERTTLEYQQALRIVMEESQRVLRTIDDLLLLTQLGYQQSVFKFEQFDFLEFFSEIIEQNRLIAANKGVGFRMNIKKNTPRMMIMGDSLHLRRLFFNIMSNAIKFTPENGCIEMGIEQKGSKIICSISDTGPGIAPENLNRIFEEFYQVDKNTPGCGLGMHIAHTIAKLHHGEIHVESQLGMGSTFRVILPSFQN